MILGLNLLLQAKDSGEEYGSGHAMLSVDPGRLAKRGTLEEPESPDSTLSARMRRPGFAEILQTRWQANRDSAHALAWHAKSQSFDAQVLIPSNRSLGRLPESTPAEMAATPAYELTPDRGTDLPVWGSDFPGSMHLAAPLATPQRPQASAEELRSANPDVHELPAPDRQITLPHDAIISSVDVVEIDGDSLFEDLAFLPGQSVLDDAAGQAGTQAGGLTPEPESSPQPTTAQPLSEAAVVRGIKAQSAAMAPEANIDDGEAATVLPAVPGRSGSRSDQDHDIPRRRNPASVSANPVTERATPNSPEPIGVSERPGTVAAAVETLLKTVSGTGEGPVERGDSGSQSSSTVTFQSLAARVQSSQLDNMNSSERLDRSLRVATSIEQPDWGFKLGRQLTLLVSRQADVARIQIDPPELGPLQVRLQLNNEQVSLQFVSQHAQVRDAVEASVARLQELFQERGLDLVDVDVSDQDRGESQRHDSTEGHGSTNEDDSGDGILTPQRISDPDDGKIDYFV